MAQSLIELGADPMIASTGELPIQVAERWNHIDLFEYFLKSKLYDIKTITACFKDSKKPRIIRLIKKYTTQEARLADPKKKSKCCLIFWWFN